MSEGKCTVVGTLGSSKWRRFVEGTERLPFLAAHGNVIVYEQTNLIHLSSPCLCGSFHSHETQVTLSVYDKGLNKRALGC